MPYRGDVPAPLPLTALLNTLWFSTLSRPATIRELISLVYRNTSMVDEPFLARIVAAARHPGALDAFCSILFSPASDRGFDELVAATEVRRARAGVDG